MKKHILSIVIMLSAVVLGQAQTLQFSQILLVDANTQTIPAGKVWKVESVPSTSEMTPPTGTTSNTNYSIAKNIVIDGVTIVISRSARFTRANSPYNSEAVSNLGIYHATELPLWLPANTTVAAGSGAHKISIIEFTVVP